MDFKYSNLSKEQMLEDLRLIVNEQPDQKWKEFFNSKYGQFYTDIFASFVDNNNYNINRRFEETFTETAKLDESVITLSHDKGYDIQRAIPSKTQITATITNNDMFDTTDKVIMKTGTSFSIDDLYYTLTKDLTINFVNGTGIVDTDTFNAVEGVKKTDIVSKENLSSFKFQEIASEKATNIFGDVIGISDDVYDYCRMTLGEQDDNGDDVILYTYEISDGEGGFTSVDIYDYMVSRTLNYNSYDILLGYNNIEKNDSDTEDRFTSNYELSLYLNTLESESDKVLPLAYVRTSRGKMLEMCFGDGRLIRFPRNNVRVTYFTTNGSLGNRNLISRKCDLFSRNIELYQDGSSTPVVRDPNTPNPLVDNLMNYISFTFAKNSINGIDLESMNEIALNTDSFFAMQDRIVTMPDHNSYFNRGLYKSLLFKFWGEKTESEYFQDISPYHANNVFINYSGVNDDIYNEGTNNSIVPVNALFFNNLDGFASKYYVDDGSVSIPTDLASQNQITLTSYKDFLYMYYIREMLPLKLLSSIKNGSLLNSSIDNRNLLDDMIKSLDKIGVATANYTYVPTINYLNFAISFVFTYKGNSNVASNVKVAIENKVTSLLKENRGIELETIKNTITSDYRVVSDIKTTVAINETNTTVADIVNKADNNNIFEDKFIQYICASEKSLYDLFVSNEYFSGFPSITNILSYSSDNVRLVEGFKNRVSARRLASLYRETFRFMFVMQMNGYLNSLTVDDIYNRVNNFYEFVESSMRYDVCKNLLTDGSYTNFSLPNEIVHLDTGTGGNVSFEHIAKDLSR